MNDEIKEILDDYSCIPRIKKLGDYITNLQQELEEEKRIEEADLKTIQRLEEENERLKLNHKQLKDIEKMAISNSKLIQENERLKGITYNPEETNNGWIEEESELRKVYRERDDYKSRCEKAIEYIKNFSVDKSFSFPLMKRWEENQVKTSIDYEFNDTLKKDLLNILQNGSESK